MTKLPIASKKKLLFILIMVQAVLLLLSLRVLYIQTVQSQFLQAKAYEQQTRDRLITPNRGTIYDRNMIGIAKTETVSSVSVIRAQIKDKEEVARILSEKLELDYDTVLAKVSKRVALERIKTKVDKEIAMDIQKLNLPGVIIDEDIKRIYPFSTMASHVIGFVGKDNQGIIGLEAIYEKYLKGQSGKILQEADVYGKELIGGQEFRLEPEQGKNLVVSLDVVVQQFAEQTLAKIVEIKQAKRGSIILMNPQNGEIYAMANKPDFNLNEPFTINNPELEALWSTLSEETKSNALNQMWRNFSINDTYEPGSTFKIITSVAGLEDKKVTTSDTFTCSGSVTVGGRTIKCWRFPRSHGHEDFVEGVKNSCNPVFIEVAERVGKETFYKYLKDLGLNSKTGIDVPGEAVGIMHNLSKVGPVELATMSFGQSFQITPLQLLRATAATINGGFLITPHFGTKILDAQGNIVEEIKFAEPPQIISKETSDIMRQILEAVVFDGTGNKTYLPGYRVGGKTATSEKLPRRSGKYIASFVAFAPADDPQVLALVLIDEPQGAYYGGQVAGPVMKELLQSVLPYLGIKPVYSEKELSLPEAATFTVGNYMGVPVGEAKKILKDLGINIEIIGEGDMVTKQFPLPNEVINKGSKVILYANNIVSEEEQ